MNEPIELSFRYSAAEITRAMRSHYASRLRTRLDISMSLLCFAAGGALWTSARGFALFLLTAASVFMLILIAAFGVVPFFMFRLQPKFRDQYSLTFDSQGIRFRTEHIDSHLEWSLYTRAKITPNFYLLYYGPASFTIVPKRVFASPGQQRTFEELLSRHIPNPITKA